MKARLVWQPAAKQRPRTTYRGGSPRTFTPRETVAAERNLRAQWPEVPPVEGPIAVTITMHDDWVDVDVEERPAGECPRLKRGDIDNYLKLVMDALNGTAWVDDRQIVELHGEKL